MAWEVRLHDSVAKRLKSLGDEFAPQIEEALSRLASDPAGLAHRPVLPFAWKGPVWDFKLRYTTGQRLLAHNVTLCFLFDDDPNILKIYVHDILLCSFSGAA